MPAETLSKMAFRACCKYIRQIHDIGDVPYKNLREILFKIENAEHLHGLELRSPQIIGHDAELWIELIRRDIPNAEEWLLHLNEEDTCKPSEPRDWYKIYRTLLKESKSRVDEDAQLLKAKLDGIKNERMQKVAKKVELRGVKVPKGVKTAKDVIRLPRNSAVFAKDHNSKDLRPEYTQWERKHGRLHGDHLHPKLKHAPPTISKTSKSVMDQFRKEAIAMKRFSRPKIYKQPLNSGAVGSPDGACNQLTLTNTRTNRMPADSPAGPLSKASARLPGNEPPECNSRTRTDEVGNPKVTHDRRDQDPLPHSSLSSLRKDRHPSPAHATTVSSETQTSQLHRPQIVGHPAIESNRGPLAETDEQSELGVKDTHAPVPMETRSIAPSKRPGRIKSKTVVSPFMPCKRRKL